MLFTLYLVIWYLYFVFFLPIEDVLFLYVYSIPYFKEISFNKNRSINRLEIHIRRNQSRLTLKQLVLHLWSDRSAGSSSEEKVVVVAGCTRTLSRFCRWRRDRGTKYIQLEKRRFDCRTIETQSIILRDFLFFVFVVFYILCGWWCWCWWWDVILINAPSQQHHDNEDNDLSVYT
jgi:hypothetical protein